MSLVTLKIGDQVQYPDLFAGIESPVILTVVNLTSDGKKRFCLFHATILGIPLGTVAAMESGSNVSWEGVLL